MKELIKKYDELKSAKITSRNVKNGFLPTHLIVRKDSKKSIYELADIYDEYKNKVEKSVPNDEVIVNPTRLFDLNQEDYKKVEIPIVEEEDLLEELDVEVSDDNLNFLVSMVESMMKALKKKSIIIGGVSIELGVSDKPKKPTNKANSINSAINKYCKLLENNEDVENNKRKLKAKFEELKTIKPDYTPNAKNKDGGVPLTYKWYQIVMK